MILNIPDNLIKDESYQMEDLQIDFAIFLYKSEKVTLARAARWLNLNRLEFQKILADRKIPINFSVEDFQEDLKTLASMSS